MISEAAAIVDGFRRSPLYDALRTADQKDVEMPFLLRLEHGVLEGKIDVLYRRGTRWRVVDYKTSHVDGEDWRASVTRLHERYRPQMEAYALAVARLFGVAEVDAALYLTNVPREVPCGAFTGAQLDAIERALNDRLAAMAKLDPACFAPRKGVGCDHCAYLDRRLCDPTTGPKVDARRRSVAPALRHD